MPSARAKKAAAAQRVNASAAFHQHDAAQPALQVPTVQFSSPAEFRFMAKPNPDHPASDQLFATVAALQHLCDEHDMAHVSPPPIWPMILHGAMPDPFGGDDEAAVTRCLDAIAHGNDVTMRLAIRGAVRLLEAKLICSGLGAAALKPLATMPTAGSGPVLPNGPTPADTAETKEKTAAAATEG
jgi:hypothetical protein